MVEIPVKTDPWGVVRRGGNKAGSCFFNARELSNVVRRVWLRMDNLLFDRSTDGAARFPDEISTLIWVTISALLWLAIVWFGLKLI
jgi:hypothetical protein